MSTARKKRERMTLVLGAQKIKVMKGNGWQVLPKGGEVKLLSYRTGGVGGVARSGNFARARGVEQLREPKLYS